MNLNPSIFDGLMKLRVINFGYNRIEELDKNILNGLINFNARSDNKDCVALLRNQKSASSSFTKNQ